MCSKVLKFIILLTLTIAFKVFKNYETKYYKKRVEKIKNMFNFIC